MATETARILIIPPQFHRRALQRRASYKAVVEALEKRTDKRRIISRTVRHLRSRGVLVEMMDGHLMVRQPTDRLVPLADGIFAFGPNGDLHEEALTSTSALTGALI